MLGRKQRAVRPFRQPRSDEGDFLLGGNGRDVSHDLTRGIENLNASPAAADELRLLLVYNNMLHCENLRRHEIEFQLTIDILLGTR